MEKSVQCDNLADAYLADIQKSGQLDGIADNNLADTKNENQKVIQTDDVMTSVAVTNGDAPFPSTTQTDETTATNDNQSQPLVKAISEEKHLFQKNILGKTVKDDMNLEILNFYSQKENRLNFLLNPLMPKPASLVTVMKFQQGEFVEVKTSSSYNSSMCLRDMKKAITAALNSCISQSNEEEPSSQPCASSCQDMLSNSSAENNPQGKNVSPKKTPPKKVVEGTTGTTGNITSTTDASKSQSNSPKSNTGSKAKGQRSTSNGAKGTTEAQKAVEKSGKTPEKAKEKTVEAPKYKQLTKEKVEPSKPAQTRVKKPKIPDEESIKFANRQREIQRMKKELKERLKREGKDGVDPVARINAWGRTVGVTCTMCGNHVQKSYGCFRRDTAPEKLRHLFTPGMNRIKICRRCLPYKKHGGKPEQENKVSKPGLLSLPGEPQGLNPGSNTPITIAPLPDKPVSASTLSAIHRKVTGQESAGQEKSAHVNIFTSQVNSSLGHMNISGGVGNNSSGHVNVVPSLVNNGTGQVNADSGHMNTEPCHVIDATVPFPPPEIDLSGQSNQGPAVEYIKKLALNLRTNYNGQQGDGSVMGKQEIVTPEEQIIKTPIIEHLSNFTPVTPSMSLENQVTNSPSVNVSGATVQAAQWKPVLNQVTPVSQPVMEGNAIPTPPWTTVPIVLQTQPNIVLTSPGHVPRDPKCAPLQTFVTTANQNDLKLLPAIMMPSQNALPRQGPVLLQIQRVKLVRDRIPEEVINKDKMTEHQGQQNPMMEQSETGLKITDYGGYARNICDSSAGHQTLPEEISSAEVESSISNFLSQAKEISSTQVEPPSGNFHTLTENNSGVEASTVDLQSIAGEISSSQVETSTDDIKKITEQIASLIEDASGYTQDKDTNVVDAIGHLGTDQNMELVREDQSQKGLNVVESKLSETSCVQPSEDLGEQMLSCGDMEISYNQHEPSVVVCESADISSQDTLNPSAYEMINEKDDGQRVMPEAPTNRCVQNIFASQISEEFLPHMNVEKLNAMNNLEQETETEFMKSDDLLSEGGNLEEKELPDVTSDTSGAHLMENIEGHLGEKNLKNITNQCESLEEMGKEFPVEMHEDNQTMEERHDDVEKEKASTDKVSQKNDQSQGEVKDKKDDSNLTTKTREKTVKETRAHAVPKDNPCSATVISDENVTLDLRRSQRRTASPRKASPSKIPAKKIEPKVHGTRQQRQKEAGQQGMHKDKTGPQGAQKDKTGQQSAQKDKTGPLGTQRAKTERQGSQKDEKEPEATQGVKRKRPGRVTKPAKFPKQ